MSNSLGGIIAENNGKISSTRIVLLVWAVGVLVVWGYASFGSGELEQIPDSVVGIFGILMGGKVVQKYGENPATKKSDGIDVPENLKSIAM